MQLQTLEPSKWTAREKYLEYLKAEKQSHDKRMGYIKNAYRELSRGAQVIDLFQVMRSTGLDAQLRPKLAICRADAKWCFMQRTFQNGDPVVRFAVKESVYTKHDAIVLPAAIFPGDVPQRTYRAMLPSIPPDKLAAAKGKKLVDLQLLWEAEWQGIPPTDPALLQHLGGPFYKVLATWDLTAVERAALEFSIRSSQ